MDITELGNPGCPQGEYGKLMLEGMNEHHAPVTVWALSFLAQMQAEAVLDIGCGGGATLARLSRLFPEAKIFGMDYSDVSVKESSEFNKELIDSGRLEVIKSSVEAMPFKDNLFDCITTVESFYFWPDPQENLKEVCRVLKPGGTFLLIADIYGSPDLDEAALENIKKYNLFNPTPKQFEELLKKAGFADVTIHLNPGTTWICAEGRKTA